MLHLHKGKKHKQLIYQRRSLGSGRAVVTGKQADRRKGREKALHYGFVPLFKMLKFILLKKRAEEMAQWVELPAVKADDPSLIPTTQVERKN